MKTATTIFALFCLLVISTNASARNGEPVSNSASELSANTSKVSGRIIDKQTGEGLAGALVKLNGNNIKAYTDLDGNFTLEKLLPGQYDIIVSYISYDTHIMQNITLESGKGEDITIEINPKQ